jgi:hypothetical protein
MIYLCSPYTHSDPAVRQQRFELACHAAAMLILQGKVVFSPIAHGHPICCHGVPHNWQFWERNDRCHLETCEEVVVLMIDGWLDSVGVQAEIAIARELGKSVTYLHLAAQAEENPCHRINEREVG